MRKKLLIISSIFLTLIFLYFAGGLISSNIVLSNIFDKRMSNLETLLEPEYKIYKNRDDYNSLNNRIEYDFYSDNNKLKGYYYKNNNSKGLVIACHGMTSQADGMDIAYQNYFFENNYSVFSFDLTAHGRSEGNSISGLHQAAYDVKACYDFIFDNKLNENNIILIGHSLGGYGVAAALNLGVKANYLITFSAFDNPYDTMVRYSKNSVGDIINLTIPTFNMTTSFKYGDNKNLSASSGIKESNINSLIIHGKDDISIPYNDASLYAKVKDYNNVNAILLDDCGHNTPWYSINANNYVKNEIKSKLEELKNNKKELNDYIDTIDKNKTSELSNVVFDNINKFLNS